MIFGAIGRRSACLGTLQQQSTWIKKIPPGSVAQSVEQPRKLSGLVLDCKILWLLETERRGSVAQSVEQRPFKALVPGSSPGRPMPLMGTNSGSGAIVQIFFVCRALSGLSRHEYCFRETVASANYRLVNDPGPDYQQ